MIGKIIHYVWLGKKEKPKKVIDNIKTWKKYCPDYTIIEWNEDNLSFDDCAFLFEAYESKNYAFSSDYIRAKVLYKYGGIYLDTDVEIFKSFDNFLDEDFFCGFENNVMLQTAVIGASRGCNVIEDLLQYYENQSYFKNKKKPFLMTNVILLSVILKEKYNFKLNNTLQKSKEDNQIYALYPFEYFCAKDYVSKKIYITENTYSVHYYYSSWIKKKNRIEDNFVYGLYKVFGKKIFLKIERMFLCLRVKKYTKILNKKGAIL